MITFKNFVEEGAIASSALHAKLRKLKDGEGFETEIGGKWFEVIRSHGTYDVYDKDGKVTHYPTYNKASTFLQSVGGAITMLEAKGTKFFIKFQDLHGHQVDVEVDKMEAKFKSMNVDYDDPFMHYSSDLCFTVDKSEAAAVEKFIEKHKKIKFIKKV